MKKTLPAFIGLLCLWLPGGIAQAQVPGGITGRAPAADVNPAKAKEIRRLLELSGGIEAGKQIWSQMLPSLKEAAPQAPAAFWEEIDNEVRAEFPIGGLVDAVIRIYDKYFTLDEITQLVQFYESPIGRKFSATIPQMATESMAAGQEWAAQVMGRIQEKMKSKGYTVQK